MERVSGWERMSEVNITEVDVPPGAYRTGRWVEVWLKLLSMSPGRALKIDISDPTDNCSLQQSIRQRAQRAGLKVHTKSAPGSVFVWLTEKTEAVGASNGLKL